MSGTTPASASPGPGPDPAVDFEAVAASERFGRLRRVHRGFVFPVAVLFLVWYFVYVLLAAYHHDLMATPVFGSVNVGLLLGLGQFVTTFVITMTYVRFANRRLDPRATEIRTDLESGRSGTGTDAGPRPEGGAR